MNKGIIYWNIDLEKWFKNKLKLYQQRTPINSTRIQHFSSTTKNIENDIKEASNEVSKNHNKYEDNIISATPTKITKTRIEVETNYLFLVNEFLSKLTYSIRVQSNYSNMVKLI